MLIRFWGVRSQVPTPGKDYIKYGGSTPCIEIRNNDDNILILEAGTGIRLLGDFLMKNDFKNGPLNLNMLVSDIRWDHTQGFPFFTPLFIPSSEITWHGPKQKEGNLESYMAGSMKYIYFPVRLDELKSKQLFRDLMEGIHSTKNFTIASIYLPNDHISMGYRIEADGASIVYLPGYNYPDLRIDNRLEKLVDFAKDADIIIHETYFEAEGKDYQYGWGHCTYDQAIELAKKTKAKKLMFYGYQPGHTDNIIDRIINEYQEIIKNDTDFTTEIIPATENMLINL